ncbi:hypothetical protein ACWDOR_07225 [Streptosporangium canum]|uniref:hypothetical protein n=1 Tax=Streptosporangium canum TaxID=324952 RepID=UPI0037A4E6D7
MSNSSGNPPHGGQNAHLYRRAERLQAAAEQTRAAELAEKARLAERAKIAQRAQWSMADRKAEWDTAGRAKAAQARVDAKFFDRMWSQLKPGSQRIVKAMTVGGLAVVGIPLVVTALMHVADPSKYFDDRSTWNEMLEDLKVSAWDVWITYFSEVAPYWRGHASETVQRYLRFELIGMFDELGRIATEISGTLTTLAWDIVDYNTSLVDLVTSCAPILLALVPFAGTLPGKALLMAAAFGFLKLLWGLVKEFLGKIKSLDLKLETLGHKMFELRGLFNVGDNKLHLKPVGYDPNLWVPVTKEN